MTTRPTTRKMTTAAIALRLNAGVASTADRRVYLSRVERLWLHRGPEPCRYGHFDCAATEGGPCSNEVVSELPIDDERRSSD
jgi:hypothetical protein